MADLVNKFSWSFSAAADFEECRRRRYWAKYGMWNGWSRDATPEQKLSYRLNKMESRFSIQGRAVEDSVMWMLGRHREGREATVDEAYEAVARPLLNTAWKESKSGRWREDPKRCCCLHEHYYGRLDDARQKEMVAGIIETTKRCIANFRERVLPRVLPVTPEQEIPVATVGQGDPESFEFEGVKVYAIPDYAYEIDDEVHIHDWKSGRQKAEHEDQLAIYGLWANVKLGRPAEKMQVYLEYLGEGVVATRRLAEEDLEGAREAIRASVMDMRDYLVDGDVARNEPAPKDEWELSATRDPCRLCRFYELCEPEFQEDEAL